MLPWVGSRPGPYLLWLKCHHCRAQYNLMASIDAPLSARHNLEGAIPYLPEGKWRQAFGSVHYGKRRPLEE